jgi:imidazolonepropionase-like amidohydrolase
MMNRTFKIQSCLKPAVATGARRSRRINVVSPKTGRIFNSSKFRPAFAALLTLLLLGTSSARAETVLLYHAVVHTVSSPTITNGAVLITGGKIDAVLDDTGAGSVGSDKQIDLKGQHLYPGMIDMDSSLGLTEIEAVRATDDMREVGSYTPDVQAWVAVNPDSELLAVTRANGVGYFECAPQGGVVAGMSGVVALDGWTVEQMTIKRVAALHVYWPDMDLNTMARGRGRRRPGSEKVKSLDEQAKERREKLKALDDFFQEARAYEKARGVKGKGKPGETNVNPPYEAMLPVVRGEVPIMVHANDIRQIKAAAKWAKTNMLNIAIVGGRDAWMAADVLAAGTIPVVYEATFDMPHLDAESYDVYFHEAEVLRKAGVKVVFSGGPGNSSASLAKNVPYFASQAVAFGYPAADALRGLTLYPAQLLGVDDRLGSIQKDKEATLFVCDGDILDIRAQVTRMWIAGKEISLENRHTRLYEKYKNRPLPK